MSQESSYQSLVLTSQDYVITLPIIQVCSLGINFNLNVSLSSFSWDMTTSFRLLPSWLSNEWLNLPTSLMCINYREVLFLAGRYDLASPLSMLNSAAINIIIPVCILNMDSGYILSILFQFPWYFLTLRHTCLL